jgi:hypothetical protein
MVTVLPPRSEPPAGLRAVTVGAYISPDVGQSGAGRLQAVEWVTRTMPLQGETSSACASEERLRFVGGARFLLVAGGRNVLGVWPGGAFL